MPLFVGTCSLLFAAISLSKIALSEIKSPARAVLKPMDDVGSTTLLSFVVADVLEVWPF